jgi:hypothetical protein
MQFQAMGRLGAGPGPSMVPCGVYALTLMQRGSSFAALPSTIALQGAITPPDANGFQQVTVVNVSSQPFVIPPGFGPYSIIQYQPQGLSTTGPCAAGAPTPLPPPAMVPSCPAGQVWNGSACVAGSTGASGPGAGNTSTSPWVYVGAAAALAAAIGGIWYYRRQHRPTRRLTYRPRSLTGRLKVG